MTGHYIKNSSYASNNGDYWLGTELNLDGAVSNASHFHKRMTLFDANSSLSHAESLTHVKVAKVLFHLSLPLRILLRAHFTAGL